MKKVGKLEISNNFSHQFPQATSFSDRMSGSGVYFPTHCFWLPAKGVWRCCGACWLRPQAATPPKQSGFAHRWLRPQVATPLKWSSSPKVEGELSTEKGYTIT